MAEPITTPSANPGEQLYPALNAVDLQALANSDRFRRLDKAEAYYRCVQYETRRFDWDGHLLTAGEPIVMATWPVPLVQRKPKVRFDLPRIITDRLTAMVFGADRFPQIVVDGDEDAQEYAREMGRVGGLNAALVQARNKGGAMGSGCLSWALIDGLPRISVHNPKHITILRWADRYEHRPAAVLESYMHLRPVYDSKTGRVREAAYYFARYWDEQVEVVWEPIPQEAARNPGVWQRLPRASAAHGLGFCPVYWCQNKADCDDVDGDGDWDAQEGRFDEINELLSATGKGTKANVDPTLVVRADPSLNLGQVKKGTGQAIFSPNGAEYLELRGDSLKAALLLLAEHKQQALDTSGVVLGNAEMAAKALSAAALRVLYLPMINEADKLREQYGRMACAILRDMLRAARAIGKREPGPIVTTEDGRRLQAMPAILLDKRTVDDVEQDRVPGTSERVTLNWPPYFPNSWADIKSASDALSTAAGGGKIISRRTAVENAASIFGIADVDEELEAIAEDTATDIAFAQQALGPEGNDAQGGKGFKGERQGDGDEE